MIQIAEFKMLLQRAPVLPVLTISDVAKAEPLARALLAGGIKAIEVTLRTPDALMALSDMKQAAPELCIGAGTILSGEGVDSAYKAGADFLVTPGTTSSLIEALTECDMIAIPGIASASEAMARYEEGFTLQKFFPAEASGGHGFLKSLAGPLPHIDFIPTGGITNDNVMDYLALPNVIGIGGSWIATQDDIVSADWIEIERKTASAVSKLAG